jgi:YHS domain-containing protein
MELDVVCGMQVDPAKAAGSSEYNGNSEGWLGRGR